MLTAMRLLICDLEVAPANWRVSLHFHNLPGGRLLVALFSPSLLEMARLLSPAVPWKESGERVTVLTLLALLVQKCKY